MPGSMTGVGASPSEGLGKKGAIREKRRKSRNREELSRLWAGNVTGDFVAFVKAKGKDRWMDRLGLDDDAGEREV
jgi:hypothetical protein